MTASTTTGEQFRTNDMVLATLLHMQEFEYSHEKGVRVRKDGSRVDECNWLFVFDEEDLDEAHQIIEGFTNNKARVEPRTFATMWAGVRGEMLEYLHGPRS